MITSTPTVRSSRLAEFLSEGSAGGARTSRGSEGHAEDFSRSLERALGDRQTARLSPAEIPRSGTYAPQSQTASPADVARRFPACAEEDRIQQKAGGGLEGSEPAPPPKRTGSLIPSLTREDWTEEMLTEDLSAETLRQMKSPAEFLNARLAHIRKPTTAEVASALDGATYPVNPSSLSTLEQAEMVRERLRELGIDAEITEAQMTVGPFHYQWNSEDRRIYRVAGLNVGLVMEKYARNTKETADRMLLEQFQV